MMFLDFLYIVCCDFYRKREPNMFKFSGLILLTLVFNLNITLLSLVIDQIKIFHHNSYEYHLYWLVIGTLLVFFPLYIRYYKYTNYEKINNNSFLLSENVRNRYYRFSVMYIVLSIFSTFGTIFYLAGKVEGWWS